MLKRFFLLCSGADTKLLEQCTDSEQNKYVGIGATVFFTAVMAFLASSYALYTVFNNYITAIFFGIVWGLLIFNLDRYIVSTLKKNDNFKSELLQALPRIVLAFIIAVVISKPLELKIFEKEINQVLLTEKNTMTLENKEQIALQYKPKIASIQQEINDLKEEITQKKAEVNNLYDTYIAEAEGRKGTKKLGKGPVYKEKREKHDAALAELQVLKAHNAEKIKLKEADLSNLITKQSEAEANSQPVIDNVDGLMARLNALDKLPWLPSFFIFLLFLTIETSPILVKLLANKGEYDIKLADRENAVQTLVAQNINERNLAQTTADAVNTKVYNDIAEENELYNYKVKKARELMKIQADSFYKKQQDYL